MSDLIQWPMERVTYAGIDNPIFVDDILAANQAILSAIAALSGLEATDFAIISGFDYDGSTNYGPGVIWLYGQFYYCPGGCVTGQYLTGALVAALSEGFDDGNSRNIYSSFLATAVANNTGAGPFSPQFEGVMDTYRAGNKRLMLAINALQEIAAELGDAAYLNVGSGAGTVMAGNDPRAPYTAAQLDARYAQQSQVIIKNAGTAYSPTLETDPATRGYVDSVAVTVLAKGRTNVGDIPAGGTSITISFGVTVPSTSYMLIFTLASLGTPANDATSHTPAVIDSSKTTTSLLLRFQEGVGTTQDLAIDWILIPH